MSRRLVLIVEDSTDLAANLEIACAAIQNVEVKIAPGAELAWQMLGEVRLGDTLVIVTDIRLPDTDGFELIRRVRAVERLRGTPIVAVSGDGDPELPDQLAALDVRAFYRKPYSPVALKNHIEVLLNAPVP